MPVLGTLERRRFEEGNTWRETSSFRSSFNRLVIALLSYLNEILRQQNPNLEAIFPFPEKCTLLIKTEDDKYYLLQLEQNGAVYSLAPVKVELLPIPNSSQESFNCLNYQNGSLSLQIPDGIAPSSGAGTLPAVLKISLQQQYRWDYDTVLSPPLQQKLLNLTAEIKEFLDKLKIKPQNKSEQEKNLKEVFEKLSAIGILQFIASFTPEQSPPKGHPVPQRPRFQLAPQPA